MKVQDLGDRDRSVAFLKEVKAILAVPERWTKGTYARDVLGEPIWALNPKACSFCLSGALYRAGGGRGFNGSAFWCIENILCGRGIPSFNDDKFTHHDDVLRVLDEAIALAETLPDRPAEVLPEGLTEFLA